MHPPSAPAPVLAADRDVAATAPCPVLAAVTARAKALRKWRKHERTPLFLGWCATCHALGFSF